MSMFGLFEICCFGFSFLVSVSLVSFVLAGMAGKSKGVYPADVMDWLLDFLLGASKCGADVLADDGGSDGDADGNSDAERSVTLAPKDDATRRSSIDSMLSTAVPAVPPAELTQRCAMSP